MVFARAPERWDKVDEKDARTPDRWVRRHPSLVRHTGKHPCNVEPLLSDLARHGHQTPASLFYVRNHGAVPVVFGGDADEKRVFEAWRIRVRPGTNAPRGCIDSVFSIAQLRALEVFPCVVVVVVVVVVVGEASFSVDSPRPRAGLMIEFPFEDRWNKKTDARCDDVRHNVNCLLVCAGNRRKEQNMLRRTLGFNWGTAGLGMSTWSGVALATVLVACGVPTDPSKQDGYHVLFRGPKKELPWGVDGSYGTSLPLRYAMDRSNDVLLAWLQNGMPLAPDHGFPLRVVIPGFIGGRMVKWVEDFEITDGQSTNHYHLHDNRVLPVNVTSDQADAESWWVKPQYIINELNINSAIWRPAHYETLPLGGGGGGVGVGVGASSSGSKEGTSSSYELAGYAYSGGGREVIRVEVTLDGGASWRLVARENMSHPPATPNAAGKYFGWVTWRLAVPVAALRASSRIAVRAWDASMNCQPRDLTWNVMGMLNNPWFTVEVHLEEAEDGDVLRFEHPTQPGQLPGGWMTPEAVQRPERGHRSEPPHGPATHAGRFTLESPSPSNDDKAEAAVLNATELEKDEDPRSSKTKKKKMIPRSELAKHTEADDCWIAVRGLVYDVTDYIKEDDHPGGVESILMNAGADSTKDFAAIHSTKAWAQLDRFLVGTLVEDESVGHASEAAVSASEEATEEEEEEEEEDDDDDDEGGGLEGVPKTTLRGPGKRVSLPLAERRRTSADTEVLRFSLPSPDHVLGLGVGLHLEVSAPNDLVGQRPGEWNGLPDGDAEVERKYTPPGLDAPGSVDLVVKVYEPTALFPDGGKMSRYLSLIPLGHRVDFSGPWGLHEYLGRGQWQRKTSGDSPMRRFARLGMLAGGTGITPLLRVLAAVLADPKDATEVALVYANRTEDDILLRGTIDAYARDHPTRFRVHYTLDRPPPDWASSTGFVTPDMIARHLPPPTEGTLVLLCGPGPMVDHCKANLDKLGYARTSQMCF